MSGFVAVVVSFVVVGYQSVVAGYQLVAVVQLEPALAHGAVKVAHCQELDH